MAFDKSVDLLVVGSGSGGMVAALRAAQQGAEVLLVEKGAVWGGTSGTSGGGVWIPGSHAAAAAGHPDDLDDAFAYIRALTADNVPDSLVRAYVDNAHRMLKWAEDTAGVAFAALPYPDYYPEAPGSREGYRTHLLPGVLDARKMDRKAFDTMQRVSPAASLFGRINWLFAETYIALYRPRGWWKTVGKMMARYWLDIPQRLRSKSDRRLTLAPALMGLLRNAFDKAGAKMWLSSPFVSLIEEDGRIVGAVVRHEGKDVRIEARKGVVLATGGFERNAELRRKYLKDAYNPGVSGGQVNNMGDALVEAMRHGAATRNLDSAWYAPMFHVPGEDRGRLSTMERAMPFSIIVNQEGKRYANEALAYHRFAETMIRVNRTDGKVDPSWFVFDATYRFRYPVGAVLPLIPDALLSAGARKVLVKASTVAGLARKMKVDPAVLEATVSRFNAMAKAGKDTEFGRGDQAYDRLYGDPGVSPNPTLGAVEKAPFYAVPLHLGDIGTNGGLVTDERAHVLREDGSMIPGLYAIGNVSASVMGYSYPGAGSTLGPAMTFGYLAAADAMGINA